MLEGGRGSCLRGERFMFEGGEVHVGGGGTAKESLQILDLVVGISGYVISNHV